jgi:hypothetical protein
MLISTSTFPSVGLLMGGMPGNRALFGMAVCSRESALQKLLAE